MTNAANEPAIISATEAVSRGIDPAALHRVADWHEERAASPGSNSRHAKMAVRLRAVAFRTRDLLNAA